MPRIHLAAASMLVCGLAGAQPSPVAPHEIRELDVAVSTPVYPIDGDLVLPVGRFDYRLSWLGIPVARARIETRGSSDPQHRSASVRVLGATHPVIDLFFRYRIGLRGIVHTAPFRPGVVVMDECENDRYRWTEIGFRSDDGRVRALRLWKGELEEYRFRSHNTFDIPSTVLLLMNLELAPGAHYAIDTFTGTARYLLTVDVREREIIRLAGERRDAWRVRAVTRELAEADPEVVVQSDRDERHRGTDVWVAAERPHQVLRARSRTFVGSIGFELAAERGGPGDELDAEARCR